MVCGMYENVRSQETPDSEKPGDDLLRRQAANGASCYTSVYTVWEPSFFRLWPPTLWKVKQTQKTKKDLPIILELQRCHSTCKEALFSYLLFSSIFFELSDNAPYRLFRGHSTRQSLQWLTLHSLLQTPEKSQECLL